MNGIVSQLAKWPEKNMTPLPLAIAALGFARPGASGSGAPRDDCRFSNGIGMSGAAHTELANYVAGGITAMGLIPLISRHMLSVNKDYVTSGSIPGIAIGTSLQAHYCDGRENCLNQIAPSGSVTPFIDVKVSTKAQFRLSLPIMNIRTISAAGTTGVPTFTATPTLTAVSALSAL